MQFQLGRLISSKSPPPWRLGVSDYGGEMLCSVADECDAQKAKQ